jgi:hypothetical protein
MNELISDITIPPFFEKIFSKIDKLNDNLDKINDKINILGVEIKNIENNINIINKNNEKLNNKFVRRCFIFLVIWMGCSDLLVAFIITVGFILISNTLLCILTIDNPSTITKEKYDIAKQIVQKYEESQQYIPISLNIQQTNNNSNNLKSEQSTSIDNNSIKT